MPHLIPSIMKKNFPFLSICVLSLLFVNTELSAQTNKQYTDQELLKMFKGLRVADVSDGMDMVGLKDVGLLAPEITALWKDIDSFSHFFCGIALTVRYVPTNRSTTPASGEDYKKWRDQWYGRISPEPFIDSI